MRKINHFIGKTDNVIGRSRYYPDYQYMSSEQNNMMEILL